MSTSDSTLTAPKDVVLHIGSGKTGTSSLQYLMSHNRERLESFSVLYPHSPGPRRHLRLGLFVRSDAELQTQLSWHRLGAVPPAKFRKRFEHRFLNELEQSDVPRVLLSDEALYGVSEGAIRRLRELTDRIARSVRVVVYLRRQDDHMVSRYQQVVKTGEVRRLAERFHEVNFPATYDYRARLRSWESLLEPTDFVVRPFERDRFVNENLYDDFLSSVGIEAGADELEHVETVNESLDAECVEFLRILNIYRVQHDGSQPGLINNRDVVARLAEVSSGPTLTLPERDLDVFMERWEDSNRAVAEQLMGESSGVLFRSPRKTRNTTTEQRLDPDRLNHFLAVAEIPEPMHAPLRRLVEQEAMAQP